MRRIIIICEGQTEQSFCKCVLQPNFTSRSIQLQTPTTKRNGGGIVNWDALKNQIRKHLLEDTTAIVTTLIDYYGIYKHHKFPGWEAAQRFSNVSDAVDSIQNEMKLDLDSSIRDRFIPYIQLYEFEALLFCDVNVFLAYFEKNDFSDYLYLEETIRTNPNPETINNNVSTAPSKRLQKIIKGYDKAIFGSLIAEEISLHVIRAKCLRFNSWLSQLENK